MGALMIMPQELLGLMGMPVLRAEAEAEALCARLNGEGHVDACITSDSDAFLYGAQCVIKSIHPNTKVYIVFLISVYIFFFVLIKC